MNEAERRVRANNRIRTGLRARLYNLRRVLRGQDVLADKGIQRIGEDGRVHTLAKMSMAIWVETDRHDIAEVELAYRLEKEFGDIGWNADVSPSRVALLQQRRAAQGTG